MLTNTIYPINLVAWHKLGVKYLLTEHNLKENFCISHQLAVSKAKKNNPSTLNKKDNTALDLRNKHSEAKKVYESTKEHHHVDLKKHTVINAEINDHGSNLQVLQEEKERLGHGPKILPLHEWPKVWKELLSNKNSAKVIWTYSGLEDDISGSGNTERKELIRRLIKELAFPAGTHAFWPLSLPQNEDQQLNTQIFWSSAEILKAKAIVIMGSTALSAINLPRKLRPLQQTVYSGYMIIVLPDINFLINEMHKYTPVREFIRTALKKYIHS